MDDPILGARESGRDGGAQRCLPPSGLVAGERQGDGDVQSRDMLVWLTTRRLFGHVTGVG